MCCPPSSEFDKGMRDAEGLIRRNWGVLCLRSGLPHLPSPPLPRCFAALGSARQPREPLHWSIPTTLVINPQILVPNLPCHLKHPLPITGEIPKSGSLPLQLPRPLCSCPFPWEQPGTLDRNAFSSRKCQFIKTLPKKRSLQRNFSFQKSSGEKKRKDTQWFNYPVSTALNEK